MKIIIKGVIHIKNAAGYEIVQARCFGNSCSYDITTFICIKMSNWSNGTDHQPLLSFCIQQSTPDEDLKPEDYLEFKRLGSACLAEGASAQLQQFLEDKMNQVFQVYWQHIYRKTDVLRWYDHTLFTGSHRTLIVLSCQTAIKSIKAVTLQPPEVNRSLFSCNWTMVKVYTQPAGLLTWRCGQKTRKYSVRFLAPLLTLLQYSAKCPCLSNPSTRLPTVLCTTLLEAHVISNSLLFLSAEQSQRGLNDWLSNRKSFAWHQIIKKGTCRELWAAQSH